MGIEGHPLPVLANARPLTREIAAEIARCLRSGKSLKETAWITRETYENVRVILHRYPEVRRSLLSDDKPALKEPPAKKLAG